MVDSAAAIKFVMQREGGFTDNPRDSGGATNYGLSLRFLREIPSERLRRYGIFKPGEQLGVEDVRELTPQQAFMIYEVEIVKAGRFDEINDQDILNYVLDMVVHHGKPQAVKLIQRSSWAINHKHKYLADDGIMGDKTLSFLNSQGNIPVLMAVRAGFMRLLVEIRPQNKEFLNGWLNRAYTL
jgi:lysozyme family protein